MGGIGVKSTHSNDSLGEPISFFILNMLEADSPNKPQESVNTSARESWVYLNLEFTKIFYAIILIIRCMKERPTGIVLLVSLEFLAGIFALGMTLYLLTLTYFPGNSVTYFTLFGVMSLILAYGLWIGKRWARTITLILSIIGILLWLSNILGVLSISPSSFLNSIINIVLNMVIIYYLTRPHLKDYFR